MRKIFFYLSIALLLIACSEKSKKSDANNENSNSVLLSSDGIGEVKIGMTQAELEKILNQKIPLTNPTDTVSGSWEDSAKIKYRDIDMELDFQRDHFEADTFRMVIIGIRANSPLCKTSSGIGIGTDHLKIINTYEDNTVAIQPGFYDYTDNIEPSETKKTIIISDYSNPNILRFYLENKKVVKFEIYMRFEGNEGG